MTDFCNSTWALTQPKGRQNWILWLYDFINIQFCNSKSMARLLSVRVQCLSHGHGDVAVDRQFADRIKLLARKRKFGDRKACIFQGGCPALIHPPPNRPFPHPDKKMIATMTDFKNLGFAWFSILC